MRRPQNSSGVLCSLTFDLGLRENGAGAFGAWHTSFTPSPSEAWKEYPET